MTTIPKDQLISEMQAIGERIAELAATFDEDVHLSVGAFSDGYIKCQLSIFEGEGENTKVVAMPVRRYYSTVNKMWTGDEEDAYPEVNQEAED